MPSSRAEATSQRAFSMNQAGRRKVTGTPTSTRARSSRVRWVSRFSCGASAPIVERHTTLSGRAVVSASAMARTTARASGNPGAGSNSDGGRMNTPSMPANAFASCAASAMSASATRSPALPRRSPCRHCGLRRGRAAGGQQRTSELASYLAGNSCDREHGGSSASSARPVRPWTDTTDLTPRHA